MKQLLILFALVTAAMLFAGTGMVLAQQPESDPSQSSSKEDFVIGEVLVKFEEGTYKAKKEEIHKKKGGRTKEVIGGIDVEVVAVDRGKEKFKAKEYRTTRTSSTPR